jgi:hypothetical protein
MGQGCQVLGGKGRLIQELRLDAPYFLAAFGGSVGGFVPGLAWSFAGRPGVVALAAEPM